MPGRIEPCFPKLTGSSWKEITIPRLFKGAEIPDQSVPCSDIRKYPLGDLGWGKRDEMLHWFHN